MTPPDATEDPALAAWLALHGWSLEGARALAGDVSTRRYMRLDAGERRAILALYPPELRSDCGRFERSGALLAAAGIRVPRVFAADSAGRWMLLEDLGPHTVYELQTPTASGLERTFDSAARIVARIATLPREPVARLNPPLDARLLSRELEQTMEVFLRPQGLTDAGALDDRLRALFAEICDRLASPPAAPAHRDFMVRNLVPLAGGDELGVLDHQGLRMAPPLYDLASLLNDSLFPPPVVEERLLAEYASGAGDRERYHRAAAQRTLKAVGTYAAFAGRGESRHLHLVAPTLQRALRHLAALPEGRDLAPELGRRWASRSHVLLD